MPIKTTKFHWNTHILTTSLGNSASC